MVDLIHVTPVEYQKKRIVRYYGYKLGNIDAGRLAAIVKELNVKEFPKIWQEEDLVFYEYPKRPVIIIKEGRLYTTVDVWNSGKFTYEQIRHQASILLRILGGAQLASFHRKAVPKKHFIPRMYRK